MLVACLGLIVGACNADASSSTSAHRTPGHHGGRSGGTSAPARDTFTGSVTSGTGAYSGFHSRLKIYLHPHGSGDTRSLLVVIRDQCGNTHGNCHPLTGRLTGTLKRSRHQLPDTGDHFTVASRGQVSPLGDTRAVGSVEGTGFIARGLEEMKLTLHSASGTVTVQAQTGPVKGFQSP